MVMGRTKCFLVECEACITEGIHACYCKLVKNKWGRRSQDWGRRTTLILLQVHAVKSLSEFFCIHRYTFVALTLVKTIIFVVWELNTVSLQAKLWSLSNMECSATRNWHQYLQHKTQEIPRERDRNYSYKKIFELNQASKRMREQVQLPVGITC